MKLVQRIIVFICILSIMSACGASSSEKNKNSIEPNAFLLSDIITIPGLDQQFIDPLPDLNLNAESAFLMHVDTHDVLYENHSDEAFPIASMSKIMTELLVLEKIEAGELNWEDKIEISDYAYTISNHPGYASVLLKKDQKYTVQELFSAMAIRSANGATIALAEAISGTEKEFVHLMNDRAEKLDLTSAKFVNSTGLTNKHLKGFDTIGELEDTNVMSASDLSRLALYVMENYPELLDITDQKELEFHGETFKNSNWMLPGAEVDLIEEDVTFGGVNGLKTGHTEEAGYCFTGSVEIDGEQFISVVIGTPEIGDHFIETKTLYNALEKQIEKE